MRAYPESLRLGEPMPASSALTIADGIAVKRPGELTFGLLKRWADDVVIVGEDETAEAMVVLMERAKLVVEGAGAVGVAALLGGQVPRRPVGHDGRGPLRRQRRRRPAGLDRPPPRDRGGRRLVLLHAAARPARQLVRLLECVAGEGANIVDVSHVREGVDLHVRETAVELVHRDPRPEHADAVVAALNGAGYDTRVVR